MLGSNTSVPDKDDPVSKKLRLNFALCKAVIPKIEKISIVIRKQGCALVNFRSIAFCDKIGCRK